MLNTPNLGLTALTQKHISSLHGKIDFLAIDPYVAQYASPVEDMTACLQNTFLRLVIPYLFFLNPKFDIQTDTMENSISEA